MSQTIADLFLDFSRSKLLNQYWPRLRTAVEPLTPQQVWWRANPSSNSIGNLILHLNGNLGQWIVAAFNKLEDKRNRPAEFAASEGMDAKELLALLGATIDQVAEVLSRLTEADLVAPYHVQGYNVTGLANVYQAVEHFGLHYGQIVYISKALRDIDLGFYKELNQTGRARRDSASRP